MSLEVSVTKEEGLSRPYGNCSDVPNYDMPTGFKHSNRLCKMICAQNAIIRNCGCYDFSLPYAHGNGTNVQSCHTFSDLSPGCKSEANWKLSKCGQEVYSWFKRFNCVEETLRNISTEDISACGCVERCTKFRYESKPSLSWWPVYEQARSLMKDILSDDQFKDRFSSVKKFNKYFPYNYTGKHNSTSHITIQVNTTSTSHITIQVNTFICSISGIKYAQSTVGNGLTKYEHTPFDKDGVPYYHYLFYES